MVWWWTPMFWWWFSGVWWLNPFFCPIIAPLPVAGGMFAPEVLAQWELRPTSSWRKAQSGPWRSQESSSKVWRFPMSWRVSPNDPKSDHLSIKTYGFHLFPYIYICIYVWFSIPNHPFWDTPIDGSLPAIAGVAGRPWRQETTSSPAASTSLNEASRLSKMPRIFRRRDDGTNLDEKRLVLQALP